MRLTDIAIRALPAPAKGQRIYADDTLPGFGCRISRGGTRSFILQHGADRRLITIGRYPAISLAEARAAAKRLLAEFTLGRHLPQTISWDDARDEFLAICEQKNKPRTVRDYRRLLKRHFGFGKRRLSEITPRDINQRLGRLRSTISEQNHALVGAKVFLRWAQRKHYLDHSPCEGMQTVKLPTRHRVLTDVELAAVYNAAEDLGYPFGSIVQLCILTGQRRSEIAWLRRSYIAEGIVTFPPLFTKNKRAHMFPIGPLAQSVIASIPDQGDLIFPAARGDKVFSGWSKQKTALDRKTTSRRAEVAPWTLHDLRRTFSTRLAELSVQPHVVERILNHITGTISGVAAIYNRASYLDEMRAAIAAWEARLSSLLNSA